MSTETKTLVVFTCDGAEPDLIESSTHHPHYYRTRIEGLIDLGSDRWHVDEDRETAFCSSCWPRERCRRQGGHEFNGPKNLSSGTYFLVCKRCDYIHTNIEEFGGQTATQEERRNRIVETAKYLLDRRVTANWRELPWPGEEQPP